MTIAEEFPWPIQPYRGLNYFRPSDRPLLTGRDQEIVHCASLLAHPQTRVLLLHGATGCGKSSFLRAGLIPAMESEGALYLFLRVSALEDEALFIRCTEAPVDQISRQVFLFASAPFELRTPMGPREISLRAALLGAETWEDYLDLVRREDALTRSLQAIARIIPQTLVLIVDQAEEVLTLNPTEEQQENRTRFFQFLREFQQLEFDARIIVTLRTEFYGRFADAIRMRRRVAEEFQQFYLDDLSQTALVEAIVRPTLRSPVGRFGAPYSHYHFSFENGLPETIVKDVQEARYSGPALPILQLVCLGLHSLAAKDREFQITAEMYTGRGAVFGYMIRHMRRAISSLYEKVEDYRRDFPRLLTFLENFYSMQDDNTVVSRTRTEAWALEQLSRLELKICPATLIESLASPQTMILRRLRNVKPDGSLMAELTLGHDSVALALERWKARHAEKQIRELIARKEEDQRLMSQFRKHLTSGVTSSVVSILGFIAAVFAFFKLGATTRIASDTSGIISRLIPELQSFAESSAPHYATATIFMVLTGAILRQQVRQLMRSVDDLSMMSRRRDRTKLPGRTRMEILTTAVFGPAKKKKKKKKKKRRPTPKKR